MMDMRDTRYWPKMSSEEHKDYIYVLQKFYQAESEFEFFLREKVVGIAPLGMEELLDVYLRAMGDLVEYERVIILKYWDKFSHPPGGGNTSN